MKNVFKKMCIPVIFAMTILYILVFLSGFTDVMADGYAQTIEADFSKAESVDSVDLGNGARVAGGKLIIDPNSKIGLVGQITYFIFTVTGIENSGEFKISFGNGFFVSVDSASEKIKSNVSGTVTEIDLSEQINLTGSYKLRVKVTNGRYEGKVVLDEWVFEKTPSVVEIGIAGADDSALATDNFIASFNCSVVEEGKIEIENISSTQAKIQKFQLAPISSHYEIERRDYREEDDVKEYPVKPDVNEKVNLKTVLLIAIPILTVACVSVSVVVIIAKKRRKN